MSENYVTSDGFKPLVLPERGEDLIVGRQYALTPLARHIIAEEYGLRGLPTVVECIRSRVAACEITIIRKNVETGKTTTVTRREEEQSETFRAYLGATNKPVFIVSLKKLEELAEFYDQSHKLPGDVNKHTAEQLARLEEEWFKVTSQMSNTKFRGQPLRWWSRGDSGAAPTAKKLTGGTVIRARKEIDLSILNLA